MKIVHTKMGARAFVSYTKLCFKQMRSGSSKELLRTMVRYKHPRSENYQHATRGTPICRIPKEAETIKNCNKTCIQRYLITIFLVLYHMQMIQGSLNKHVCLYGRMYWTRCDTECCLHPTKILILQRVRVLVTLGYVWKVLHIPSRIMYQNHY